MTRRRQPWRDHKEENSGKKNGMGNSTYARTKEGWCFWSKGQQRDIDIK